MDRPLTAEESRLVRWLLEHGNREKDTQEFLSQLHKARVISGCPCGCASVDFAVAGQLPPAGAGMEILSDYQWDSDSGAKFGVFVFAKAGVLAGLEVWSIDGLETPVNLPRIESLKPLYEEDPKPG